MSFAFSDVSCYIIFKTVQGRSITTCQIVRMCVCMYVNMHVCVIYLNLEIGNIITSCKATPYVPRTSN